MGFAGVAQWTSGGDQLIQDLHCLAFLGTEMEMNGVVSMLEMIWHHSEESAGTLLQFAVIPVLKILVLCAFGLGLASSHINILPAASRKLLSKVSRSSIPTWCDIPIVESTKSLVPGLTISV